MQLIFFTHLIKKDLLIETKGVAIKEGRVADKHLIEKDPQSPPIHCLVVTPRLKKEKILGNTFFGFLTWIISGARYSGVPHNVHVLSVTRLANLDLKITTVLNQRKEEFIQFDLTVIVFANPKSIIFKCPSLSRRRFSGFRSLKKKFFGCACTMFTMYINREPAYSDHTIATIMISY